MSLAEQGTPSEQQGARDRRSSSPKEAVRGSGAEVRRFCLVVVYVRAIKRKQRYRKAAILMQRLDDEVAIRRAAEPVAPVGFFMMGKTVGVDRGRKERRDCSAPDA